MLSILQTNRETPAAHAPGASSHPPAEARERASRAIAPHAIAPDPGTAVNPSGRKAKRVPAAAVPAITRLRISPRGIDAVLVNISSTGLLAQCGDRVQTGLRVLIHVDGTFEPAQIPGTVVRNYVASVSSDGRLIYQVAVLFARPIELDAASDVPAPTAVAGASDRPASVALDAATDAAAPIAQASEPSPARVVQNRW